MRARFGMLFPIVMLALMAQIFAPIGACWARSAMMADPLRAAEFCNPGKSGADSSTSGSTQQAMHDCCSACSLAVAPVIPADPDAYAIAPSQSVRELAWAHIDETCARQQRDRNAQARAPPTLS